MIFFTVYMEGPARLHRTDLDFNHDVVAQAMQWVGTRPSIELLTDAGKRHVTWKRFLWEDEHLKTASTARASFKASLYPAAPNYPLGDPKYHLIKTIRLLIELHWGSGSI